MLSWLSANIGTILITFLLLAVVAIIVIKLRKDKKKGVSSCGGNCAHCQLAGKCHASQQKKI
ncbi:MAG: FeoB-associated Cys-rich membrane protein [Clostridia bacterium]|nr:FeoB-associated Cys-rich membrane protein [Clostridia bacterium]